MSGEGSRKVDNGHCLCGAVKYKLVGDPLYNVVCHCPNCRRTSGSTFVTAGIYPKVVSAQLNTNPRNCAHYSPQNFTITCGEDAITCYEDKATDSSIPLMRNFCKICGSKTFATTKLRDDIVSIPAGTLENAGQDWVPVKEQYCKYKAGWVPDFGLLQKHVAGPTTEPPTH
jgi:hypothetical protein